ncbi:MAG: hypothetical protein OXT67_06695 [Zetaproteobacteria bacterium]|nr:hypothetical protein [Zetaproteobacteria bacterium]
MSRVWVKWGLVLNLCVCLCPSFVFARTLEEIHKESNENRATKNYVHKWLYFPALIGMDLSGARKVIKARPGTLEIYVSLASWCVPCQDMVKEMMRLEEKYKDRDCRFTYVFYHDVPADVKGFLRRYPVRRYILASDQVRQVLHNPNLPGVYVADRWGWIMARRMFRQKSDVEFLDRLIYQTTIY